MAATKPQLSGRDSATRSPSRAPIAAPARRRSAELRSASHAAPAVVAPTNGMYQRLYHLGALESRNTSKSAQRRAVGTNLKAKYEGSRDNHWNQRARHRSQGC